MDRIFMSFLGTSSYKQANYRLDGSSCLTRFWAHPRMSSLSNRERFLKKAVS